MSVMFQSDEARRTIEGWYERFRERLPMPTEARLRRLVAGIFTTAGDLWTPYFGDAIRAYRLDLRVPPLVTRAELAAFAGPALVVGASDDVHFPGAKLCARAKELLPQAETHLLEGAKHAPATDDASRAALCERIAGFLG